MMSSLPTLLGLAPPDFIYVTDASAHRLAAATVADALASLDDTPTAFVNAVACFTPRLFYDTVLNALADWHVSWASGCENWSGRTGNQRWNDNLDGFLHGLRELAEQCNPTRIVIAIERAERLCENLPELIVPLSRLAELVISPPSYVLRNLTFLSALSIRLDYQ
jgi:origin recognition complex subunit 5